MWSSWPYHAPFIMPWFTVVNSASMFKWSSTPDLLQVSWLRWADMSVLTVGGLVFSSDPRLLVTVTQLSASTVSWKLYIARWVCQRVDMILSWCLEWLTLMLATTSVRSTLSPNRVLMSPLLSQVYTWCFVIIGNKDTQSYSLFSRQHYERGSPCWDRWWRNVQRFQCWQFWQQSETKTRQIIFPISERNCVQHRLLAR